MVKIKITSNPNQQRIQEEITYMLIGKCIFQKRTFLENKLKRKGKIANAEKRKKNSLTKNNLTQKMIKKTWGWREREREVGPSYGPFLFLKWQLGFEDPTLQWELIVQVKITEKKM